MDTEVQKVINVSNLGPVGSKELPEHGFPINPAFLTEAVHAVSVNGITKLAEKFSPIQVFPLLNKLGPDDCDLAAQSLNALTEEIDYSFLLAVGWVYRLVVTKKSNHFENRNIPFSSNEDEGEYLARCLLSYPDIFHEVICRLVGDDYYKGVSFTLVKCNKAPTQIKNISFDKNLEEELKEHFKETGCGEFLKLLPSNHGRNHGISVERGGKRSGKAVIDLKENACSRRDRPRKTDITFYCPLTNCLWTSAKSRQDIAKYRILMGQTLFGDITAFTNQVGLNLTFLVQENLADIIQNFSAGRITKIKIKYAVLRSNSVEKEEKIFRSSRSGTLLENSSFMQKRTSEGIPVKVEFEVEFDDNPKKNDRITITETSLKTGNLIREEEMVAVLYGLGIMVKSYDA